LSEHTKYFAVEGVSPADIRETLRANRVVSIVENQPPDDDAAYRWVVVSAPAASGFTDGQFHYASQWPTLIALFERLLFFWMDEGQAGWRLTTADRGRVAEYEFPADVSSCPSREQIARLAEFCDVPSESLRPTLAADKAWEFCRAIGLPYLEMLDQDHSCGPDYRERGYSFLSSEISD